MIHDDREDREDLAIDALIASFSHISEGDELVPLDDPAILSDEDHKALAALGDDLVQRLLAKSQSVEPPPQVRYLPPSWSDVGSLPAAPEFFAMHRGDEHLTDDADDELERKGRELLEDDDDDTEE